MRFSVWVSASLPWSEVLERARHAEATGWDGVWIMDHFMTNTGGGLATSSPQEALSLLAGLAAAVPRIRLGPLVLGNTYRHPAVVANAAATIDDISGGRFVLGVGAGWQQNEHDAYGIDLPPVKQRLDRLEEAVEIQHRLLAGETFDFDGTYYRLQQAYVDPLVEGHTVPLLMGGSGEKRMPKLVARWADEWNSWGTPEVHAHKKPIMDAACEAIGRDPKTLLRSTQVLVHLSEDEAELAPLRGKPGRPTLVGNSDEWQGYIQDYAAAGIGEVVVPDMTLGSGKQALEKMDLFMETVAWKFRD